MAESLNDLALLYDNQGQYAKAEPLYERALAALERALGLEHPAVTTTLETMRSCYDPWAVRRKPSRWKLTQKPFGLRTLD